MVQWLQLLPHSENVLGSNRLVRQGPFCVEFACLPSYLHAFSHIVKTHAD